MPDDLVDEIGNNTYQIKGGHEYNGDLIGDLDEEKIREIAKELKTSDFYSNYINFSPVDKSHEERTKEILIEELGEDILSLSSEIGSIGLLERECHNIECFNYRCR